MTWPRNIASSTRALYRTFLLVFQTVEDDRLRSFAGAAFATMAAFFSHGRSTATAVIMQTRWISARPLPRRTVTALQRSDFQRQLDAVTAGGVSSHVCERSSISCGESGRGLTFRCRLLERPCVAIRKSCRPSSINHPSSTAPIFPQTRNDGRRPASSVWSAHGVSVTRDEAALIKRSPSNVNPYDRVILDRRLS